MNLLSPLVCITVALAFLAQSIGFAEEKMDIATDTVVIKKLEGVIQAVPDSSNRDDMKLRLADLYSERSRLYAMDETAKNCTSCKESGQDREQALKVYGEILSRVDKESRGRVVLQMAQLYQLQGRSDSAMNMFKSVVDHPADYNPELVGRAYTGLGKAEFLRIRYAQAQDYFEKALRIPETPGREHIQFKIAWCLFHKGQFKVAREMLTADLQKAGDADGTFKEEAAHDLATFISRGKVTASDVQTLAQVSPENVRKDNLVYLAHELDRLGKKEDALVVWNIVGKGEKSSQDQLESAVRLAELQFESGHLNQASQEYAGAVNLWKTRGCNEKDECAVLKNRLRKLVIDWDKSIEQAPTADLLNGYRNYLSLFPEDMEVNYRAALVARILSDWPGAIALYRKAADLSPSGRNDKNFEAALLGEIETAEISKDKNLRGQAYAHYLSADPNGAKAFEVKYQQARLLYENNQTAQSADAFRALALAPGGDSSLRNKAADLALDSLVLARESEQVPAWANEFAGVFPNRRVEFQKIANHATINAGASTINDARATQVQLKSALEKLKQVNLAAVTPKEKITNVKNKLILSERLRDLPEVQKSANELLLVKGASPADKDLALSRLAWAAEMTLDFKTAFELTRKLKNTSLSKKEKVLKMAMLAELAGADSTPYYDDYLSLSGNTPEASAVAAKLVRRSKNPQNSFMRNRKYLSAQKDLYTSLAVEVFAKTRDNKFARAMLQDKIIRSSASASVFSRFIYLEKYLKLEIFVASEKIDERSEGKLEKSLKRLLAGLKEMEKATQYAVKSGDWILQITTLDGLSRQDRRVAADIISLPAPRGLGNRQALTYRRLLAQRASEFQKQGLVFAGKVNELWNQESMSSSLVEEYNRSRGDVRGLLADELRLVARVAPRGQRMVMVQALATREIRSRPNLIQAEAAVKTDPFDPSNLENLRVLEERAEGGDTMVAYLDARISKLQSGVTR